MTTALDQKMVPAVLELIARLGVSATLEEAQSATAFNPSLGGFEMPPTAAFATVTATPLAPVTKSQVDGDTVQWGDAVTYLAGAQTITPKVGCHVEVNGQRFRVQRVEAYYSGDSVAAWGLFLRA